mmetsp:Transcript_26429/g.90166  ORF Transcript_26429/g.90166 Transcript_26429/m.90166 type:complete len:300 (+) Transcript_26429:679-1578(+)
MATHLCVPSTDTESTTNSVPFMNSCTRTAAFVSPKTFSLPTISPNLSSASANDLAMKTPSVPALLQGLSTHHAPVSPAWTLSSSPQKVFASAQLPQSFCFTARRPAARTASPMGCLSRRVSDFSMPFDGKPPKAVVSASWHSTPLSQPTRMPSRCTGSALSAATVSPGFAASYMTVAFQFNEPHAAGMIDSSSSGKACDMTRTMRKPRAWASAASRAPVDSGSTTTIASGLPSAADDRVFASGLNAAGALVSRSAAMASSSLRVSLATAASATSTRFACDRPSRRHRICATSSSLAISC